MIPSRIAVAVSLSLAAAGCGSAVRPAREVPARSVAARSRIVVPEPRRVSLSTPAPTATPKPLAGKTVAIDPGHNGDNYLHPGIINALVPAGRGQVKACDTTGTSTDAGYAEAAFNFDVALRLKRLLLAQGARVVLTRHTNTGVGPCVNVRAAIGNAARADAVIAIHADGGPPGGRGYSVIYAPDYGSTARIYGASLRLARDVNHALRASGVFPPSTYVGQNGYSVRNDLAGLNLSTRPKIFVELGNMRNSTDAAIQVRARMRQALALALDRGLERYIRSAS